MKKLRKLELDKAFLSEEELKQLKGGRDVDNNNSKENCSCTYYDGKRTINNNGIKTCSCSCLY